MSGRLTFICVLEANLALSCVPSARRWPLRLFIPKWTVRRSAFLSKAGWSWGYVSAIDSQGRTIWIADAHRDEKLFVVHADERLTVVNWNRHSRTCRRNEEESVHHSTIEPLDAD